MVEAVERGGETALTRKAKLYAKVRNNPNGVRFEEFVSLVRSFGFEFDRREGSHILYKHPSVAEFVNIQEGSGAMAKTVQVREFLKLVERHRLEQE